MRITESQLRRIVRQLVSEAPLADYMKPIAPSAGPSSSSYYLPVKGSPESERLLRHLSSPSILKRAQRLMSGFDMEVTILPVARSIGFEGDARAFFFDRRELDASGGPKLTSNVERKMYDRETRSYVSAPTKVQDIESTVGEEIFEAVRAWNRSAPSGALLFVMAGSSSPRGNNLLTPYMMLHAMFDSERGAFSFVDFLCSEVPALGEIRQIAGKLGKYVEETGYKNLRKFESCIDMKPAEVGAYSRVRTMIDFPNDVMAHCILQKGFRFFPDRLREFCDASASDFEDMQARLTRISALGPRAREGFMSWARDKVIFVDVI